MFVLDRSGATHDAFALKYASYRLQRDNEIIVAEHTGRIIV